MKQLKKILKKMNEYYRIAGGKGRQKVNLDTDDLVWLHLRIDIFLELRKSKIIQKVACPFKIIERIGGLELELLWTSTLATRTKLALGVLLYLDTLFGLL